MTRKRPHEGGTPQAATAKQQARGDSTPTDRPTMSGDPNGQWAKLYAWVAGKDLNGTAFRVLIALAAHAGPSRLTWPSHATIAAEVGVVRQTVSAAIRRLIKAGVLEEAGLMRNPAKGAWTRRYRILDTPPDQRVATQSVASSSTEDELDATDGAADATDGRPDATQPVARSSTKRTIPREAVGERFSR